MKRIACYLSGKTKLGGAERRLTRIFDSINEDIEVTIVLREYENMEDVLATYQQFALNNRVKYLFVKDSNFDLFWKVKRKKFDVIFFIGPYRAMIPYLIAGKVSGAKAVWLLVNTSLSSYIFENSGQKLLYIICSKLADRVDCLFPCSYPIVTEHVDVKKVTITPCAFTDLQKYTPKKKENTMVFLSRLVSGKNVELFIEVVDRLQDAMRKQQYIAYICGDGPLTDQIQHTINEKKIGDILKLTGYVDSVSYLPTARIFFSLQNLNNYPSQSLLEAIACGCYIVATDVGDTHVLVKEQFGELCDYTSENIEYLIKKYWDYPEEKKEEIVIQARMFAENTFTIEKSIQHYEQMIADMRR